MKTRVSPGSLSEAAAVNQTLHCRCGTVFRGRSRGGSDGVVIDRRCPGCAEVEIVWVLYEPWGPGGVTGEAA